MPRYDWFSTVEMVQWLQWNTLQSCGSSADRCVVAAGWLGAHGLLGASVSQINVDGGIRDADTDPEAYDVIVRFWQL